MSECKTSMLQNEVPSVRHRSSALAALIPEKIHLVCPVNRESGCSVMPVII